MRTSPISGASILSFAALALGLTFGSTASAQGQPQSQPCATAATQGGNAQQQPPQSASQAAQNVKDSFKSLGSVFSKKAQPAAKSAAAPCPPPEATANPAAPAGTSSAAAPAAPAANAAPAAAASPSPAPPAAASGSASLGDVQLPPAPPGGLDSSKLPDILGVHIGTPTDKVIAQLNSLYPFVRHGTGTEESGSMGNGFIKYTPTNDPPCVSSTGYFKPNTDACSSNGCQANDTMRAIFSGPPETVLVRLERSVSYGSGRPTTSDNLKAALAQKYGPNFTEYPPMTLNWDEEGKALPAPPKPVSCRGILSQQGYPGTTVVPGGPSTPNNPQRLDSYVGLLYNPGAPPLQQQLAPVLRGRCSFILVQAQINSQPGGSANGFTVIIQELPEDLRDAFAAEAYIHQAANAQSNQQLKNAQQQAAPTF